MAILVSGLGGGRWKVEDGKTEGHTNETVFAAWPECGGGIGGGT